MMLSIHKLSKTYTNGIKALDNISLEIPIGLFGLLGPNGAGKSTLMRTLASLQMPDEGKISLGKIDILKQKNELRKVLGYLPQQFDVYPKSSAQDLLNHLAILKGVTHKKERKELVDALLMRVNLIDQRKQSVKSFSGGMKQRFGIAQALIGNPKLIIVDEPTAGLDPGERNRFYNLLADIGQQAVVILSTHIVEDVRELCSNMAIINQGKLLYAGTPQNAIAQLEGKLFERKIQKNDISSYQNKYDIVSSRMIAGQPLIHIHSDVHPNEGFHPIKSNLEDVFFKIIKA